MSPSEPSNARCIVFDVYGTLMDIASPVARLQDRLGGKGPHLADLWRAKQLEYAWVATITDNYETFWSITDRAMRHSLDALGLGGDAELAQGLLDAYAAPDLYPDVMPALEALKASGHRLVAFSNADPDMLMGSLGAQGLTAVLDGTVSVDATKRFKPDQAVYKHCADFLNEANERIVFLSSNGWDVFGAETFGWTAFWVNRKGLPFEFGPRAAADVLSTLAELPDRLA